MASAAGGGRRSTTATASSLAKRHASTSSGSENSGKGATAAAALSSQHAAKKRPALANITNQRHGSGPSNPGRKSLTESSRIVPCTAKIVSVKKGSSASTNASFSVPTLPCSNVKPSMVVSSKNTAFSKSNAVLSSISVAPAPCTMNVSPDQSVSLSISIDESMSTCDSMNSPEVEYIDNNEITAVDSIERNTSNKLCISECVEVAGNICKREILAALDSDDMVVNVDGNLKDPQLCATIACDIYKHLQASEAKKRPTTDFMERVQRDINPSMRAILIDWLVEVAEEYRLIPDTLYLTVNYIDRYLSGNVMDRQKLQLLGVACMMIASKYEEICAPQVEEFCYITDNTYFKDEVLQMESAVLNYLKFEMTAPTTKCFLRRFVRAAQGVNEASSLHLECLANYIAELSLLDYNMLCFFPSLIAASSIFLARYILLPSKMPWNTTLRRYTLYQPSELRDCVLALHGLCCNSHNSSLPAVREKYSQHKYKFVAKKYCPPSIPREFFENISS
ncbi:cyclin-A1-4 isoform X2 [Olea europaea subsp. europaea]|uniref:Cyclin-A1-4 isoform X2 n=1 Tax=Olea europaea subsp. europaea TaxID=158383 RepID=A0A8S0SJ46_OLEEU|nr:cyclin-A1-4 isoform X2 [Olea europaea subsp. europaea]